MIIFVSIIWKFVMTLIWSPEAHSKRIKTSKMDAFAKKVNGCKPLTAFAKISISDI